MPKEAFERGIYQYISAVAVENLITILENQLTISRLALVLMILTQSVPHQQIKVPQLKLDGTKEAKF